MRIILDGDDAVDYIRLQKENAIREAKSSVSDLQKSNLDYRMDAFMSELARAFGMGTVPHNRIALIKAVRTAFDCGLREAKDIVEKYYHPVHYPNY